MTDLLKDNAYSALLGMIDNGQIQYGKLYSLNNITKELGMSRTPVRDALLQLESESVVDILQSRGFQLHQLGEDEILQVYHYSCAVEGYCIIMLALSVKNNISNPYIERLKKLTDELNRLYHEKAPLEKFYLCDNEFHRTINESLEDPFFNSMNKKRRGFLDRMEFHFTEFHPSPEEILPCHDAIMEALLNGDPVEAYKANIRHADLMISKYNKNKPSNR